MGKGHFERLQLLAEYRDDAFETFLSRFARNLRCRAIVVRPRQRPSPPPFGAADIAGMRGALDYDVAQIGVTRGCRRIGRVRYLEEDL